MELFPEPIRTLPEADVPLPGVRAYLSQAEGHQILFMEFSREIEVPEHAHAAQVGFVLEGRIDLVIAGRKHTYRKGDHYTVPAGVRHSAWIYSGYADITFFHEPHRYPPKLRG